MEETDKKLLIRYRKGQVDALEALVEKYRRPLFGFIVNMTEGRDDAEEIFQEVWFRVIRRLSVYRHKNFFGWLVRIAHNLVVDRARRKKPDFSLDEEREDGRSTMADVFGNDPGPSARLEVSDVAQHIASAAAKLPLEQREVFVMRAKAGLSFKEIAGIQGVSINTALARMQYALSKLRVLLKRDYEDLDSIR